MLFFRKIVYLCTEEQREILMKENANAAAEMVPAFFIVRRASRAR